MRTYKRFILYTIRHIDIIWTYVNFVEAVTGHTFQLLLPLCPFHLKWPVSLEYFILSKTHLPTPASIPGSISLHWMFAVHFLFDAITKCAASTSYNLKHYLQFSEAWAGWFIIKLICCHCKKCFFLSLTFSILPWPYSSLHWSPL